MRPSARQLALVESTVAVADDGGYSISELFRHPSSVHLKNAVRGGMRGAGHGIFFLVGYRKQVSRTDFALDHLFFDTKKSGSYADLFCFFFFIVKHFITLVFYHGFDPQADKFFSQR